MSPRQQPGRRAQERRLAKKLRFLAKVALLLARTVVASPLVASAVGRIHKATVTLAPLRRNDDPASNAPVRGSHYSPLEARIVAAIAASPRRLFGKEIARQLGMKYDTYFKFFLASLLRRGVLTHEHEGYGLGPSPSGGTAP